MQKFPKLERVEGERTADRGVFTEAELQAMFAKASPFELGLFGTLSIFGPCVCPPCRASHIRRGHRYRHLNLNARHER
jgi:hypothetical protein